MRWLHINHKGPMWPRAGLFIHADTDKYAAYAPGVDLVLAFTGFKARVFEDAFSRTTITARPRYWVRLSVYRRGFSMARGVTPASARS